MLTMSTPKLGIVGIVFFIALVHASPSIAAPPATGAASAPPLKCEIRREAFCIYQGVWEITRRVDEKRDGTIDWILSDQSRPQAPLIVLEPYGCDENLADSVVALGFEENVQWQGKSWDQMPVRLRADGSCDLRLLLPADTGDQMEWAFSTGRNLIAACKDQQCTPIVPAIGTVTEKYWKQLKHLSPAQ
jgi:hypothetical protein